MITYVNSVFVSNLESSNLVTVSTAGDFSGVTEGKLVLIDVDTDTSISATTTRFKVGMGTSNGIKWSGIINVDDIKGWTVNAYAADTEDTCYIDLSGATSVIGSGKILSSAGKRIIVRLTFKDLPTRYRKWTESYEYITKDGDTVKSIAINIAKMINGQSKRARVIASVGEMNSTSTSADATVGSKYYHADANWDGNSASSNDNTIKLVAMTYDDDNSVDSINWYNKVRFNTNMYYTDPAAEGWESLNKHFLTGATITKFAGKTSPSSAKLVRDREAQAMGYDGILNRGEGTWPIIKPAMNTNLSKHYSSVTIEFENTYRAADDIFRKTKQAVEIYVAMSTSNITTELAKLTSAVVDTEKE